MTAFVRRAILAGLSAWLLLSLAGPVTAQEGLQEQRRRAVREGTHVLRRILHDHNFTALDDFDKLKDDPASTVLIVLGNLDTLTEVPGGLKRFVEAGGAVLLASDRPPQQVNVSLALKQVAGVAISDNTVRAFNTGECYLEKTFCPILVPRVGARPALLEVDHRVATNVPALLIPQNWRFVVPGGVQVLATLPPCHYVHLERRRWLLPNLGTREFMVGGELGKGRVLVLADHSIFINEMMLPEDNHNVEFTVACVRWLRGDDGIALGRRKQVLLIGDSGKPETNLAVPLKSAVIGPEEALRLLYANRNQLLVKAEETLVDLEQKNFFNDQLSRLIDRLNLAPGGLVSLLLVFATLALIVYGVYRLGIRARFKHPGDAQPLAGEVGRALPAVPLVAQRTLALVRLGNLNEPASRLAARWFERQGMPVEVNGPEEPTVLVAGGWWRRWQVRQRLRWLWRLAQGRSTERLGPAALWGLRRELDRLEAGRRRGEWRAGAERATSAEEQGRGGAA